MGEILPDGSMDRYTNICPDCGEEITVNIQGQSSHKCKTILEKCMEIKELKELGDDFMDEIKKHSFPTGSYVFFETKNPDSDIDLVVSPHCEYDFQFAIDTGCVYLHGKEKDHYFQDEFQSCYGLYKGYLVNFLFMHRQEFFNKWKYATQKMKDKLSGDRVFREMLSDKKFRVNEFENFKAEFNS